MTASPTTAPSAALPTTRDENWRYAPLRGIEKLRWEPAASTPATIDAARALLTPPVHGAGDAARWVFVDGRLESVLSSPAAADALRFTAQDAATGGDLPTTTDPDLAFVRLNRHHSREALALRVPAGASVTLELVFVGVAVGHPSIVIELGAGATLRLFEHHLGAAGALANLALDLRLAEGARLEHARLLQPAAGARHFETLQIRLAAGAALQLTQVTAGGAATRSTALVELAGADASLGWHAALLGSAQQAHDAYVRVTHDAPGARTVQGYRGIAADRSRIAFNGHMRVTPRARGASTEQTLRSLVAGPEAEADARPQLEIDTDAVRASHGATVGKLDDDMLFYLLSRGIAPEAAESLLKWAFVSDVLARLPDAALRARFEAAIAPLLPGAAAARSLA